MESMIFMSSTCLVNNLGAIRTKADIKPPSGFDTHVSRRQAAALLGFASEFKVRQLEKTGRLRPVRGVMGSAWYPRADVLALRARIGADAQTPGGDARWSDAALIAHLREPARSGQPRTAVDLVTETGISISRAERVYRFWLAHDAHPFADAARTGRARKPEPADASERRADERRERDALLLEMRDPDPKVRAAAFEKLKRQRPI
jgi:hypothetical protein